MLGLGPTPVTERRAKMADYIADSLFRSLGPVTGRFNAQDVAASLSKLTDGPVTILSEGPDAVHVSMSVSPERLAGMAALRYSDGASHEDVTAWLEKATAGKFREHLSEIVSDKGQKRWAYLPPHLVMTFTYGPEGGP